MNDILFFSELEKIWQSLPTTVNQSSNNISLVCIDPATDRTQLPSQLIHAHKWTNKVSWVYILPHLNIKQLYSKGRK